MDSQFKKYLNLDSLVSLGLGIAVVAVIAILIVSYIREKQTPVPNSNSTTKQEQNATESATLPAMHTVTKGETLWSIAEKTIGSGYNWIDIAKANNLPDPDIITEGEKLTIPNVPKIVPGQISSASIEVKRPPDGKYTVQKGDTLWSISMAIYGTGYRWNEIATLNELSDPNVIHHGNVLMLP